ncbi:PREDICTED: uncharacterized protein LOC106124746 [Papilio xuthus]|uniref:Uncharacterized protein LOC106124746 n=1 Tax=Papilio xuthus TaxID=66420 RepID=A0A194PR09_PAPXU|nr:PREDICTED: uncharacterized protein LOC106124746 [Papilio xuthus]KPI95184.1 hypothetical protein RR46_12188 [Papilio xuthus]
MYRSVFLLFIIYSVTESHHCHGDHDCIVNFRLNRNNNRKFEKLFDKVSRNVIAADREVHHGCGATTTNPIHEVIGSDFYVLKYTLPEFTGANFTIRIKHRVIYFNAYKSNGLSFRDVRILPQIIRTQSAQWFMENGIVNVMFNYKSPLTTVTAKLCVEYVDEVILTVPMMAVISNNLRDGDIGTALDLSSNV